MNSIENKLKEIAVLNQLKEIKILNQLILNLYVLKQGVGMNYEVMKRADALLLDLARLNPGLYFSQNDTVAGIKRASDTDEGILNSLLSISEKNSVDMYTALNRAAYAIRVMCSHVRIKFLQAKKNGHPMEQDMPELFHLLVPFFKKRRSSSSTSGVFVFFRTGGDDGSSDEDGADDADDDADDDDPVVASWFDGFAEKGFRLLSSGAVEEASWYEHGIGGFVVTFYDDGQFTHTEVPNEFLLDGKITLPEEDKKRKKETKEPKTVEVKKRPAAKVPELVAPEPKRIKVGAAAGECDVDEEHHEKIAEAVVDEGHDEKIAEADVDEAGVKEMEVLLVKCHAEDKWGIHLCTSGKDRCQVLEFWGKNREQQFHEHISEVMAPALLPVSGTFLVKQVPKDVIADLRQIARKAREEFYSKV